MANLYSIRFSIIIFIQSSLATSRTSKSAFSSSAGSKMQILRSSRGEALLNDLYRPPLAVYYVYTLYVYCTCIMYMYIMFIHCILYMYCIYVYCVRTKLFPPDIHFFILYLSAIVIFVFLSFTYIHLYSATFTYLPFSLVVHPNKLHPHIRRPRL